MKKTNVPDDAVSGVNIVPVIDVTLVLLVILLLMSPVINQPTLPVNLPEAITKETKDQNLTVSLSAEGQISVDTDIIPWQKLGSQLAARLKGRPDVVVIVRADKSLPYGHVENLIREVNRYVGNRAVAIATKQRSAKLTPMETASAAPISAVKP